MTIPAAQFFSTIIRGAPAPNIQGYFSDAHLLRGDVQVYSGSGIRLARLFTDWYVSTNEVDFYQLLSGDRHTAIRGSVERGFANLFARGIENITVEFMYMVEARESLGLATITSSDNDACIAGPLKAMSLRHAKEAMINGAFFLLPELTA